MGRVARNPIALAVIAIIVLILIGSTVAIVPETKQAVITRFGEPQRIINEYRSGEPYGRTGGGGGGGCRARPPAFLGEAGGGRGGRGGGGGRVIWVLY
jgi:uncharacterized membrane protein YgcG